MLAEAYNENGELGKAIAEVNKIRGCLIIYVKAQAEKYEMDLYLRRRSIAVAM